MSETVKEHHSSLNEVFRHGALVLNQCDTHELFTLTLHEANIDFKLCDLISFKKKVFAVDLPSLFDIERADIEIIYLPHLDRHVILNIEDILNLRELLSGSFTILNLNSMVHRALYNPFEGQLSA